MYPSPIRVAYRKLTADGKAYCFCPPTDGMLYVEVPSYAHLRNLIITQQWKGEAHLRTKDGYVPYFGGGIAFSFPRLRMRGVHPVWYPRKGAEPQEAMRQIIEDGWFNDEREARHWGAQHAYGGECEWLGPRGMRFSPADIEFVWIGKTPKDSRPFEELAEEIRVLLPPSIPIHDKAPPPSGKHPCRG